MPTYEYQCMACNHAFEKFHSITAAPIKQCPKCGKKKVKRLIGTGAGLIFKGSGFYITDYRSDSYKSAAKGDSGSSVSPTTSTSTTPSAPSEAKKSSTETSSSSSTAPAVAAAPKTKTTSSKSE